MNINAYGLADAVERNRRFPDTFEVPTRAERRGLRVGDHARLIFLWRQPSGGSTGVGGERMWVHVTGVSDLAGEVNYVGVLHNEPVDGNAPIQHGATVAFMAEHVCDIHRAGESWDAKAPKKALSPRPMKRIDARKKRATAR